MKHKDALTSAANLTMDHDRWLPSEARPWLIPCRGSTDPDNPKAPRAGWPWRDQCLDSIRDLQPGEIVGVVPASAGLVALDNDYPSQDAADLEPLTDLLGQPDFSHASLSGGGKCHLWFAAYAGPRQRAWRIGKLHGETRWNTGFIAMDLAYYEAWNAARLAGQFDDPRNWNWTELLPHFTATAKPPKVGKTDVSDMLRPEGASVIARMNWHRGAGLGRYDSMLRSVSSGMPGLADARLYYVALVADTRPRRVAEAEFDRAVEGARAKGLGKAPADDADGGDLLVDAGTAYSEADAPRWILDRWLPRGSVTTLYARGGVGKSRLGLQLAAAAASDRPFLGLGLDAENASYLTLEDPPSVARYRLQGLIDLGLSEAARPPRLLVPGRGVAPTLWHDGEPTPLGEQVAERAADTDVLVIDPLALAYGDSENDRAAVSAFLAWLNGVAEDSAAAILLLGHPAKSPLGEGSTYSGSTAWRNAARTLWTLKPTDQIAGASHVFEVDKLNLAPKPDALAVESKELGWRVVGPVDRDALRKQKEREREERDAEIVRLVVDQGLSQGAAAEAVGVSKSTVNAAVRRLRETP